MDGTLFDSLTTLSSSAKMMELHEAAAIARRRFVTLLEMAQQDSSRWRGTEIRLGA